jgi:hypothetical protein
MHLVDTSKRLLAIAETLHRWAGALAALDTRRRVKVARYADAIAETLARAARATVVLLADAKDVSARRDLGRELGRITGYLETLVGVLRHHLDGRKLAGVKRRLERLQPRPWRGAPQVPATEAHLDRLVAAEGYFRALADSLRA